MSYLGLQKDFGKVHRRWSVQFQRSCPAKILRVFHSLSSKSMCDNNQDGVLKRDRGRGRVQSNPPREGRTNLNYLIESLGDKI